MGRANFLFLLITLGVQSCGSSNEFRCDLQEDQTSSFTPVQSQGNRLAIRLDRRIMPNQKTSIKSALDRWNGLGTEKLQRDFFSLSSDQAWRYSRTGDPRLCKPVAPQAASRNTGEEDGFEIALASAARWRELGLSEHSPAVTLRCVTEEKTIDQAILLNEPLLDSQQMESIVLHELGHTLGLEHSCNSQGPSTSSFIACDSLSADHPYRQAVMFPYLRSPRDPLGMETKTDLTENDKMRALCRYTQVNK